MGEVEPSGGLYPLAASSPCALPEGGSCDPRTFAEECALVTDFGIACRCAADGSVDGTGVVVCDGRTPVPPLPRLCAADVIGGARCSPDEADRVCSQSDGARCICSPDGETDPAFAGYAWLCETPASDACPRGTEAGAVCFGHEGTYCRLGEARCSCVDDPLRDGLTVWECEVPIGGGPTACDATIGEGAACDATLLGERCELEGGSCVCAPSVDGGRDTTTWQCGGPPPADPTLCPDAVTSGELVECRTIGASCDLPDGSGDCRCIEGSDPRVPAMAIGFWDCGGAPPPHPGASE